MLYYIYHYFFLLLDLLDLLLYSNIIIFSDTDILTLYDNMII